MTMDKIAIVALGKQNSGKSNTWYEIFKRKIKTGVKRLILDEDELEIFVRNGSFEERGEEVEDYFEVFVKNSSFEEEGTEPSEYWDQLGLPKIVFCSVQYNEHGRETISWFHKNGYSLYIQWINPGFHDIEEYPDYLNIEEHFRGIAIFTKRSGKEKVERAAEIIRYLTDFLHTDKALNKRQSDRII